MVARSNWLRLIGFFGESENSSINFLIAILVQVTVYAGVGVSFLAVVDIPLVIALWRRGLRMSHQEVRDDHKELDGDPALRARRHAIARSRNRKRLMAAVPRATMMVVNPTHYAVALRYVRSEGGAPIVVAKGRDLIALAMRGIAIENKIPLIEDKALARSLHDSVKIDQRIPPEFYRAIADIMIVLQKRGKIRINNSAK
jgi:flagellar biosynthetic protein FlhB